MLTNLEKEFEFDEQALFSLDPQKVAIPIAREIQANTVLDAFCGSGGMSIALARCAKNVIAIDNNRDRLRMAHHNARLYGVGKSIRFILGDAFDELPGHNVSAIYLDPPWGPLGYHKSFVTMRFSDFQIDLKRIISLAISCAPLVVLKVPQNFDLKELNDLSISYRVKNAVFNRKLLYHCIFCES